MKDKKAEIELLHKTINSYMFKLSSIYLIIILFHNIFYNINLELYVVILVKKILKWQCYEECVS